ncbi:MAG: protein BatD [Calditrichaeota bacterium]|nr:protein BatD [Calditrichota bacterium]
MNGRRLLNGVGLIIWLVASQAWAGNLSVRAYLNQNRISVGQQFSVSVEASGSGASKISSPKLPDISKFADFMGSSSSQSIQFINGSMSVSKTLIYYYRATRAGAFTIPPIVVKVKGKTYKTNPLTLLIQSRTPSQPPPVAGGQQPSANPRTGTGAKSRSNSTLFLRALVNRRKVYQNEPVVVTFRIYTRVSVTGYGVKSLPRTEGFWAEDIPLPPRPQTRNEILNGVKYVVADLKKMVLFPTAPGKKVIDPMVVTCQVQIRNTRRSRDIFDDFFNDDFFGKQVERDIQSQPITITVLPLPEEGKPADFSGAVGTFNMTAKLSKDSVKANEAVTLTVKISGTGNIKMLPEPKVTIPPDFERYEPKITEKINRTATGVHGYKTFEYVLIPRFPGEQRIAPISFSYFNPVKKAYQTVHSPEFVVHVKPGAESVVSLGEGLSKEDVQLIGKDIRFIKTQPPEFQKINHFFYKTAFFWLIVFFPLIVLGGAFGYKRYQDRLTENVAFARSQKANQIAKKRLQNAKKMLAVDTQKEFFAEISRALLGFFGDKFNLPTAGIMTDEVEKLLRDRGVDEETIRRYLDCLRTCDFQRFAPANSTLEDMKRCFDDASQAIIRLEKVI